MNENYYSKASEKRKLSDSIKVEKSSLYNTDSNLHFELTYQGKNINPEEYYDKSTDEL